MADWSKILSRGDVEDRRSFRPAAIGGLSLGGVALLFLFTYLSGGSFSSALQQVGNQVLQGQGTSQVENTSQYEGQDAYETFASEVLGSNNDTWSSKFGDLGRTYTAPKLVLFRSLTDSACGGASSDVGPHYCPLDKTIYLDETFFDELTSRFGAKGGDVAQAYVLSHEVGHHIQNQLGIMGKVQDAGDNQSSIDLELQADCFAGIWANSIKDKGILEPGEISEAMDAAAAVGDDRIQQKVTGYVNPETWTHGSSSQRLTWFTKGYDNGDIASCDTFK